VVPDAVLEVNFEVSGTGDLAAVANGNPHHVDSFRQPHRYTWHGQAQAIVRPGKTPGIVTLTARAAGLRGATLALPVRPAPGPAGLNGTSR
jgi:beta-galactosidase